MDDGTKNNDFVPCPALVREAPVNDESSTRAGSRIGAGATAAAAGFQSVDASAARMVTAAAAAGRPKLLLLPALTLLTLRLLTGCVTQNVELLFPRQMLRR